MASSRLQHRSHFIAYLLNIIVDHNDCLVLFTNLHLTVAAHGVEEGPRPPLLPFERLLLTLVFRLPTMLVFKYLVLDLILPQRVRITRPVEVDHVALA